jgi:hypothetical protein
MTLNYLIVSPPKEIKSGHALQKKQEERRPRSKNLRSFTAEHQLRPSSARLGDEKIEKIGEKSKDPWLASSLAVGA